MCVYAIVTLLFWFNIIALWLVQSWDWPGCTMSRLECNYRILRLHYVILQIPNIHTLVLQLPSQMAAVVAPVFSVVWSLGCPQANLYWLEHTLGYGNGVPRLLLCYVGAYSSEYKIASCWTRVQHVYRLRLLGSFSYTLWEKVDSYDPIWLSQFHTLSPSL